MSNDAPPAGWYPNPDGTGGLRWWSGVGWTEYTRSAPAEPAEQPQPGPEPETAASWSAADAAGPGGWTPTQPEPVEQAAPSPYGRYAPADQGPLTPSGMRPLAAMFSDIGRITRRAWWPILAISVGIWAVVTVLLGVLTALLVDIPALRTGLDNLQSALDTDPAGSLSESQLDALGTDFAAVFDRLPPAGWVIAGVFVGVVSLLAGTIHVGAVSRLSMDACTDKAISWGNALHSGVTAGFRLAGYYLLLMLAGTVIIGVVVATIAVSAVLAPALGVAVAVLAFFALAALALWATGRLITAVPQAVVGARALSWSWSATRGKFWGVLGRYILWSIAASVIVNVVLTVVSIPVSALFLGQAADSSDPLASLVPALTLNLVLLPLTMAAGAVTIIGIVPIWRDLTDHPEYRGIDADGIPVPLPAVTAGGPSSAESH
jgi:hypothetical protein